MAAILVENFVPIGEAEEAFMRAAMVSARASHQAQELLSSILPWAEQRNLWQFGFITIEAASGRLYRISRYGHTDIFKHGQAIGTACLQLTITAPVYDRMFAEYLLLRNDERRYCDTANVFIFWRRHIPRPTALVAACVSFAVTLLVLGLWWRMQ